MHKLRRTSVGLGWILAFAVDVAAAQPTTPPPDITQTYPEHTRAVELGRAGQLDQGLAILRKLLRDFPDDYPLNRDYILLSKWKGDCKDALTRFERVRQHEPFEPYFVDAVADCASRQAQAGEHDAALDALEMLAARPPRNQKIERDIVVVRAWKRDCRGALEYYDRLSDRSTPEPYFALAAAECLRSEGRRKESVALLEQALEAAPGDSRLESALTRARAGLPLALRDEDYNEFIFDLASDKSDKGLREWYSRAEVSTRMATNTRVYARYLATRAEDRTYRHGDMNRAGLGVRYRFNEQLLGDAEVSSDVSESDRNGTAARLFYQPLDTWNFELGYTSWAEDIPLRARNVDIDASRWNAAAEYNSLDYVWYGRVSASRYDFSDNNERTSLFGTIGYAYEMLPYREQRVYLEAYESSNTIDTAPYFNPKHDRSLGVVHRTDFVLDSRYQRHVDTLYLAVSAYNQQGFGTDDRWSVKYEQRYDFDDFSAFSWSARYGRFIYDGTAENETRLELHYLRRF